MIKLENVTKIYRSGLRDVYGIKNVNLTIRDGEFVVVVGPQDAARQHYLI